MRHAHARTHPSPLLLLCVLLACPVGCRGVKLGPTELYTTKGGKLTKAFVKEGLVRKPVEISTAEALIDERSGVVTVSAPKPQPVCSAPSGWCTSAGGGCCRRWGRVAWWGRATCCAGCSEHCGLKPSALSCARCSPLRVVLHSSYLRETPISTPSAVVGCCGLGWVHPSPP